MPINFKDVSFTYSYKTPFENVALNDINATILDKSFTCIVGKTGCGNGWEVLC